MPSLKSSSKTGDKIALFASERRRLLESRTILEWCHDHTDDELSKLCESAVAKLKDVLVHFPETEKQPKQPAVPAGKQQPSTGGQTDTECGRADDVTVSRC